MAKEGMKAPTRKYYFENTQQPGEKVNFFFGNAPRRGLQQDNVLRNFEMKHGSVVELTEEMADHIKSKGRKCPMTEANDRGEIINTGSYLERRFTLNEI